MPSELIKSIIMKSRVRPLEHVEFIGQMFDQKLSMGCEHLF
jgi:hypothetical protein